MADELTELVEFLADKKIEVRAIASKHILGLSASAEGMKQLENVQGVLIPHLIRLSADSASIAETALSALVNMSESLSMTQTMLEKKMINRAVENVKSPKPSHLGLNLMLIANLTRTKNGAKQLLREDDPDLFGYHVKHLLRVFFEDNRAEDEAKWVANILVNITKDDAAGRRLLLDRESNLLKQLLPYTTHSSKERREGVAGCLRNCCFQQEALQWIVGQEVDAVPHLLVPLLDHKHKYDDEDVAKMPEMVRVAINKGKRVEEEESIRNLLCESLYMLTAQRPNRDHMRSINVYPIMREMNKIEESEDINETVVKIVNNLVGDEEGDPGTAPPSVGDADALVKDESKKKTQLTTQLQWEREQAEKERLANHDEEFGTLDEVD